MPKLELASK